MELEMTSKWRTLVDHRQIRRWAKERGAKPSIARRTPVDDSVGIIRLDFPGYSDFGSLEEISWEEWFQDFDENDLALIVRDEMANGQSSNFHKLVARENLEDYSESSPRGAKKKGSSGKRSLASSTKTSARRRKAAASAKRRKAA